MASDGTNSDPRRALKRGASDDLDRDVAGDGLAALAAQAASGSSSSSPHKRAKTSPQAALPTLTPSDEDQDQVMHDANQPDPVLLEVCVDNTRSAVQAHQGGAARVELCSGLLDGGLTPSWGLIRSVVRAVPIPVHVLVRPRPGDFLYSPEELHVMREDVRMCKQLGVAGVVLGVLSSDGRVDMEVMAELLELAKPMTVTFHRAFDLTRDPLQALDDLVELGVPRVLTSGQSASAPDGADVLGVLVARAAGRIVVMAGGGVRPENVAQLVRDTGVREVHASARKAEWSGMRYHRPNVYMGGEKTNVGLKEYELKFADPALVRQLCMLANTQ